MSTYQQVIVIRKDLTMRKGKMVVQGAHASLSAILNNLSDHRVIAWLCDNLSKKICVYVNSEEELLQVYKNAKKSGHVCSIIEDSGLTEFKGVPTLTCCSIGPSTKEDLQPITGHLKLL